ncbi:hypothetical protein K2X92_05690, partial [Candidatus Gracilibacteria bacterium]|nr:hypothetical protein [Candidatus Gracilibacteria bacterium]
MKKYIYCLLAIIILGASYSDSSANWYNPHARLLNNVNCDEDGETDATNPTPWGWGSTYVVQARVNPVNVPVTSNKICWHWDSTFPVATANNTSTAWFNSTINITLNKSDYGGSGVGGSSYKWNSPCSGGGSIPFLNGTNIGLAINGVNTLYLCVEDNAGNKTLDTAYSTYKYDDIVPTISATLSHPTIWRNTLTIAPIAITTWDNPGGSGIKYAKYSWDTSDATCRSSGTAVPGSIVLSTEGSHTLFLCIEDNAGNIGSWNGIYKLDHTAPVLTADNSSPSWKNTAITINLTRADSGGSDFGTSKYLWYKNGAPVPTLATCLASGTSFVTGTQTFRNVALDQGRSYIFLCGQDVAGNTTSSSFGPYLYDIVDPIVWANNNSAVWHNADYNITLFANDPIPYAGAEVSNTILSKRKYIWNYNNLTAAATFTSSHCLTNGTSFTDGNIFTLTTEGDHTLYICSEDEATNRSAVWSGQYRLDKTNPTVSLLKYASGATNGWTNNTTITLNWNAVDLPAVAPAGVIPSLIKNYDINVYCKLGAQSDPTVADLCATIPAASTTTTYNYVGTNGYSYKFQVCPRDNANNTCTTWLDSTDVARIDTTLPDPAQLNDSSPLHMVANTAQVFNFGYNDGGAPVRINYTFEQNAAPGVSDSLITPSFQWAHTYTRDISLVDNDRGINGGREWSIPITQICDWAGNCINTPSPLKTITHYSYADSANSISSATATGLTDGTAMADGTAEVFETFIRDQFGNQLIPATGIGRSVNLTLSGITNAMYLNQYARSGLTSIFLTAPSNLTDVPLNSISTQSFANPMVSTNGIYPLQIKAYTPTANSYTGSEPVSDPLANFGFTANYTVIDLALQPTRVLSQTLVNPNFKPIYTSNIAGDLRIGGFIEGTEQTSSIIPIINNPNGVTPTLVQLQLEFSGAIANKFDFYGSNTPSNNTSISSKAVMSPNPGVTSTNFYTKLIQKLNTQVDDLSDIQLSTHYNYTLDGHNIVYNSDIIGRNGYWNITTTNAGSQVGVKVIGSIGSSSISSIVTNQFAVGASIFDGYNRANVRNSIRKSIALATRNVTLVPIEPLIQNVVSVNEIVLGVNGAIISDTPSDSMMIFEKNSSNTKIDMHLTSGISGRRTIVIKGLDLFVKNDMY